MDKKVLMLASPPNQELLPPKEGYNVFLPGYDDNGIFVGYSVGVEGSTPKIGKMKPSVLYYSAFPGDPADRTLTLHYMIAVDSAYGYTVCSTAESFIPDGYLIYKVVVFADNAAGKAEGVWRYFNGAQVEEGNKFSLPGNVCNSIGGNETLYEYMRAKASGGICVYFRIEVYLNAGN